MTEEQGSGGLGGAFPTTYWSEILHSVKEGSGPRRDLLRRLLAGCWRPIYCAVRFGWDTPSAQSEAFVQAFFAELLEEDVLATLRPEQGRFRDFLRRRLHEFMMKWRDRPPPSVPKVPGIVPPEGVDGLARSHGEPDEVFDREWMMLVVERSLDALRAELQKAGKVEIYRVFQLYDIRGERPTPETAADEVGLAAADIAGALTEARKRFRRIMLATIAEYALDDQDAREELRWILG